MWKTVKLANICSIKTGKKDVNEGNSDGQYPFFTCAKKHTYSNVYSFDCEAILIAGNGAVGQTTYYHGKFEAYQRTYILSDFRDVLPKLLLSILQGKLMNHLSSMVLGNTIPYIKKGMLENFEFLLPPLAEQQRIVAKLDAAFAEIDKTIAAAENKFQALELLEKNATDELFDEVKLLASREKLGNICDLVRGPFGGSLKKNIFVERGFSVYEQQHAINDQCTSFRYFISNEKFDEMKRFTVQPNDILMSCSGTIGRTTIVPSDAPLGIINQALLKITPHSNVVPEYLNLYMKSRLFNEQLMDGVDGAAIQNVASVKVLKKIEVVLPTVYIQQTLVFKAAKNSDILDKIAEISCKKHLNLISLKSALLAAELQSEVA
ncbi:MAG: restriction endonuclease subunit S [Alphaproteobacteria bacterium]|nr:restriction endonuclease subunit S [Alphaproteobacteria bacterium]